MKKSLFSLLLILSTFFTYAQPTAANVSVSGGTGTGGAFIIGNTVTAQWNSVADGASGISAVTFDFTEFGGGASVAASDVGAGVYEATYLISGAGSTESTTADVTVNVTATVGGGSVTDNEDLTIDDSPPTATVTIDSDPIFPGDLVQVVTVTYDEAMNPLTSPTITFSSSGNFSSAGPGAWSAGNTVWTETFNHDGTSEQSFSETADVASSSGATDVAGNPDIGDSSPGFVLDTQAPTATVTVDSDPISQGDLVQVVTVTYDEAMNPLTSPTITFSSSLNFSSAGPGAWSAGNTVWTETFNHDGDAEEIGSETADVASSSGATDVVGNADVGDSSPGFVIDTQSPTATVTVDSDPITLGDLVQVVTVTYDEAMDPLTSPTITFSSSLNFSSAGPGAWSAGNTIWTETFNHDGDAEEIGSETADVASSSGATDVAGNADIGDNSPGFVIDTQAPTATVTIDSDPIFPGDLVQVVTVTYDEAMNPLTSPTITFSSSGNFSSAGPGAWSAGNTVWTETFNHDGTSEQSFSETADVASSSGATDVAGNPDIGDSSPGFVLDTQAPTATVTVDSDPISQGDLVQVVTVTYDEAMNPLTSPTITFSSSLNFSSAGPGAWSAGNTVWTETFNHDGDAEEIGSETADVASSSGATDVVGNADVGDSSPGFVIDTQSPTATVTVDSDPITLGDLVQVVTVTYDEAMDPLTSPTITFSSSLNFSSAGPGAWSAGNTIWTETFNHDGDAEEIGSETADVASSSGATDVAGNADIGDNSPGFVIDTQAPTATVTIDSDPIFPGDLVQVVTVTYDEAMNPLTSPTITFSSSGNFSSAGPGAWSAGNTVWTETFNHDGTSEQSFSETADVASSSGATDVAGNPDIGDSSPGFVLDTQAPTATVTVDSDPISQGDLVQVVTVTYDEAMNPLTSPTITFSSSLNFSSAGPGAWSAGNTVWTETFNHDGDAEEIGSETADVASSSGATDVVGNADVGDSSPGFVIDTQSPTFVDATFYDIDNNGSIDEILIEFSEDVNEGSISDANFNIGATGLGSTTFTVDNTFPTGNLIDASLTDNFVTLEVNITGTTDQSVAYVLGTLADEVGNLAVANPSVTTIDLAAPVIIDAITDDTGGTAGEIDRITVTFSENIDAATLDTDGGSDDFIVTDGAYTYTVASVALGAANEAVITLTERGSPDTGITPDINLGINDIEDQATANNTLAVAQDFTATDDGADPVIYDFELQASNAYVQIVFSEDVQGSGTGGAPALVDFNDLTGTSTSVASSITIDAITNFIGDPLSAPEDTLRFTLTVTPEPASYDAGDNVTIDTDGLTIDDLATNDLASSETVGPLQLNLITNVVTISGATWVTTNASPFRGYIEFEFSDAGGVYGSATDKSPRPAGTQGGVMETAKWSGGSNVSPCAAGEDDLCFTYANGGSTVTIDNNDSDDIEWQAGANGTGGATDAGKLITFSNNDANRISNYDGSRYRLQLDDINNGPWTGSETYTLGSSGGNTGEVNGRTDDAPMLGGYTFVFTLPDLVAEDFDNATATALDDDGDGNIDQVEVVMPDGVEDATITPTNFEFNSIPASGFMTGLTANDNTFILLFDSYPGTAVVGNLVYTAGTLEDDAEVNASYLPSGNAVDGGSIVPADGAGPVILSALTQDNDLNGKLDQVFITFSETFDDLGIDETDFTLSAGYNVTATAPTVSSPNVTIFVDEIAGAGVFDTDVTFDVTVAADILEDQAAMDGANNPAQTFTASDGAAAYATVDVLATANQNPQITGEIDDLDAQILVSVGGGTKTATNNADGTWTLPAGSLDSNLPIAVTYDVVLTTIDASNSPPNIGTDASLNELTINGGVTVTAAALQTLCNGDDYVTLGDIILTETDNGGFSDAGNIILSLPAGFEFNTSVLPTFPGSTYRDITIDLENVSDTEETEFIGTASISIEIDNDLSADQTDIVTIRGLQVRAVGSVARAVDNITRAGGTATVSAPPTASYGQLASNAQPSDITSLDVTNTDGTTNNQTSFVIRSGLTFSLDATDQQDGTVNWEENIFDASPEFVGVTATEGDLNATEGLYTYFVTNDDATCDSNPLEFELLIFSDDDPNTIPVDSTFTDKSFIVSDERDTIYLSNPVGHTANVSGAGVTVTNPGDSPNPLLVIFDPAIAGDNGMGGPLSHTITYTITNTTTLASRSETVTFTVEPETEIFLGSPPAAYCSDEGGGRLDLLTDDSDDNFPAVPYINFLYVNGLKNGFNDIVDGRDLEIGAAGGGVNWQYSLDITALGIASGEFESVRFGREIVDGAGVKRIDAVNYFIFYGVPNVRFSGLTFGDSFCSDDAEFTINRSIRYVSSVDDSDPDNPEATFFEETDVSITNGYILYINDGISNDAPAYGTGWRLVDDFTHDDGGMISDEDRFFPGDPDQDGDVAENEEGRYLIEYTTEDSGPSNCTSTIYTEINVFNQPSVPTLDAATMATGSTVGFVVNASPDPGVDGNEYLLEYCVGDDITGQNFVATEGGTADNICYYEYNATTMTYDLLGCSNSGMPFFVVLSVPGGGTNLTADETIEFFMTQQVNGCESEFRKVTVTVHPLAPVPTITDGDATLFADDYYLDFCANNGASVSPGTFEMAALGANEEYEYSVTRYNSLNAIVSTDVVRTSSRDIPIIAISNGERHEYNVRKVDNINPDASSSFTGCVGPGLDVFVFGFEEPTAVTAADFSANTLEYHVGENATALDDFDHTNLANLYTWYETNAPSGQMGSAVAGGGSFPTADLTDFDQSTVTTQYVDDVYNYYVTRTTNVDTDLGFDGCESEDVPTEVRITVHAIQPQPEVASDNSTGALGTPDFVDLDATDDVFYSICVDQLESDIRLVATEATNIATPRVFRWYVSNASFDTRGSLLPTNGTGVATFSELGLSGLNPPSTINRYFEVIQVTDNDVFEGVESESTFVRIDISPQDALTVIDESDVPLGETYCRDDDPLGDMSGDLNIALRAGTDVSDTSNVDFEIDSYLKSTYDALGPPEVDRVVETDSLPTVNLIALHDGVPGAMAVGGEPTVHVVNMFYTDPVTLCTGNIQKVITINPDPDIVFTVNDIYIDNVAFTGNDVFCYENGNVVLEAWQYIYDNTGIIDTAELVTGQFSSDITGTIGLNNGEGIFDPIAQHNAFHVVTGTDGEFLNQSTINISFVYTDGFSCNRTIDVDLFVDPQPEVLPVTGLPSSDLANNNSIIRLTDICTGSAAVTAEIQFIDPLDADPGNDQEDDYSTYAFLWTVNSLPVADLNLDGLDNTIEFVPASNSLEFLVTVTDVNGCSETYSETHDLQELPNLDIDGITDNEEFCVDDADPVLGLLDLAEDGDGATNTIDATDIVSWRVESYSEGALPAVQIASGAGTIPTVDLDAWHIDPSLTVPGMLVGGTRTFHTIFIEYTDPSREYQGIATLCTNTVSETIIVNPDPDIVFSVNGIFTDNAAFTSSNVFCYDDANVTLQAFQYEYDQTGVIDTITLGTGQFLSSNGSLGSNNGQGVFIPQNEHNGFHGVTGVNGQFLNRSTVNVSLSFTDSKTCDRTINVDLFVDPEPEVLAIPTPLLPDTDLAKSNDSNDIRITDFCSGSSAVTAEIKLIDPLDTDPGDTEEDDYSGYMFNWSIVGFTIADLDLDGLDNTFEFNPPGSSFTVEVVVTDINGCSETYTETHELQTLPDLNITGVQDFLSAGANSESSFCVDAINPVLGLTDATLDGNGGTNTVDESDIVSWTVRSYNVADGIGAAVTIDSDAGNLPTVDLVAWHTDPSLVTPGTLVGGNATYHEISITYQDPSRNYQGTPTMCTNTVVETIVVNPDPDISITLNDQDADNIEFCYDDININLQGIDLGTGLDLVGGAINRIRIGNAAGDPASFNEISSNGSANINAATYHGTNPGDEFLPQSTHTIEYTYQDGNGCERQITRQFRVNPRPRFTGDIIQAASTCATDDVELFVQMTDELMNDVTTDYSFTWFVNGEEVDGVNVVDEDGVINNATITYDFGGQLTTNFGVTATYIGTGFTTSCVASIQNQSITVGAEPIPAISWVGVTAGRVATADPSFLSGTDFTITEDNAVLADSEVDLVVLNIDGVTELNVPNPTFPIQFNYEFLTPGDHTLDLRMETTAGCDITTSRTIRILPHYTSFNASNSYSESFESATSFDLTAVQGGWLIDSLSLDGKIYYDTASSWVRGTGTTIPGTASGIDGTGAVVTVRDGVNSYGESEISFIYSPSFDLSGFTAPTVSFLRFEDFETFRDGVVFQSSVDDGRTWQTVGSYNAQLEEVGLASTPGWYNREAISSAPGSLAPGSATASNNAQVGWALESDWQEAIAPIEIDAAQSGFVRFRYALSAQADTKNSAGFAFDLFRIYERDQIVLLELFSSTLTDLSIAVNDTVDTSPQFTGNDILKINYFTDLENFGDSIDVINQRNTSEPGAKVAFYGIGEVPSISISGDANAVVSEESFPFLNAKLANARLNNPAFDITLNASVDGSGNLVVDADFAATTPFTAAQEVSLLIAVVEPVVTLTEDMGRYDNGDVIQNVLRKLLPDAAGQYEAGPIANGETRSLQTITWPISEMYDPSSIRVIAYVQDINTKVVYQATSVDLVTGLSNNVLGINEEADFLVYPNPADAEVTVEFAGGIQEDTDWVIFDQAGREVFKGQVDKGTETLTVATDEIPSGLYFIHLTGEELKQRVKRVMVIHE